MTGLRLECTILNRSRYYRHLIGTVFSDAACVEVTLLEVAGGRISMWHSHVTRGIEWLEMSASPARSPERRGKARTRMKKTIMHE